MSLTVEVCSNRKTWDARVRVTGGHPELLWGIGEAEVVTEPDVTVHRVMVHRDQQTVGYGQLLVRSEDMHTVVDAKSLHVKGPGDLMPVLEALQDYSRQQHQAAVLRISPDTAVSPELVSELEEAGYRRRDPIRKGQAGPRHMLIRLGETQKDLSRRLSQDTLDRCRAGLRATGITVRRVSANTQSLANVGLRTAHIEALLHAVGEDSVFLVATEHEQDGGESALGYLWFVHTGESAMLYRLGFTDRARELGVDDALLLTGLVQLQQRRVQKVIAGDPDDETQSVVLRELANDHVAVLGTWEYPLIGEFQIAGRAEKTRRKIFGRSEETPDDESVLEGADDDAPSGSVATTPDAALARKPKKRFWSRKSKGQARPAPGTVPGPQARGAEEGTTTAADDAVPADANPALESFEAQAEEGAGPWGAQEAEWAGSSAHDEVHQGRDTDPFDVDPDEQDARARLSAGSGGGQGESASSAGQTTAEPDRTGKSKMAKDSQGRVRGFLSRAVEEGGAALRDAARW